MRPVETAERRVRTRTFVGMGLVLGAAALGFATWDRDSAQTMGWVARHHVAATAPLTEADFDRAEVAVPDPTVLFASGTAPGGTAARAISAGEPLLRGDVRPAGAERTRAVTLTVAAERLPAGLQAGGRVDVWTGPAAAPSRVLADVPVAAVSDGSDAGGFAQIELLVPEDSGEQAVRAALADDVIVVRRP